MTMEYLQSKVHKPRIQPDLVSRPRLVDLIEKGTWRKITLVCAPPGFGKTTLLTEWSQSTKYQVCWFQEDEQDNLLDNYLGYVCCSIQQFVPEFGQEMVQMIKLTPRPGVDHFARTFIRELEKLPKKICLILDDHHLITNLEIHQFIRTVLDYLPENIHILISTREDPPIPLPRLRAKNELTEIRTGDLRFTIDETRSLISHLTKHDISKDSLEALYERIEGWAAGIQLAGLSIQESSDADKFIHDFTGSNRYILDYLVEDVLNRQPDEIRDFLVKTSFLDKFNSDLCRAVTDKENSSVILDRVKNSNLFLIPIDDNQDWFRYHNLFADLLRFRLKQELSGEEVKELHTKAARWFDARNMLAEAVQHYYLAGEMDNCTNKAIQLASMFLEQGEAAHGLDWMDTLPRDVFDSSLGLMDIYCFALITSSKVNTVEQYYPRIEKIIDEIRTFIPTDQANFLTAQLDVIKANFFSTRGEIDKAISLFDWAINNLPPGDSLLIGALIGKGVAYQNKGDFRTAEQIFTQAALISHETSQTMLEISSKSAQAAMLFATLKLHKAVDILQQTITGSKRSTGEINPVIANTYLILGNIYYCWNRSDEAQKMLDESQAWISKWGNVDVLMNYYNQAAQLSYDNDAEKARSYKKKATELASMVVLNPSTRMIATILDVFIAIKDEDVHQARHLIMDILQMHENYNDSGYTTLLMSAIEASLHFSILSPEDILPRLTRIIEVTEKNSRWLEYIRACILLSIGYLTSGKKDDAVLILKNGIEAAYEEHAIIDFIEQESQIHDLLLTIRDQSTNVRQIEFIDDILHHSGSVDHAHTEQDSKTGYLIDNLLSDREKEVVKLLAIGLSTNAIAERLVLSPGTVKRHLHNIFGKLNVQSRTQAIEEARKSGLI